MANGFNWSVTVLIDNGKDIITVWRQKFSTTFIEVHFRGRLVAFWWAFRLEKPLPA
jgi:hypothetical protein